MAPRFEIPPFPDNLPTVDLDVIDFDLLAQGDKDESRRVFESCQGTGFFLLKNHNVDSDFMFDLADSTFDLPLEEKMKYAMKPGVYFGYKHQGAHYVDKKGTPDSFETYHISKDDILCTDPTAIPLPHPKTVNDRRAELRHFMRTSHDVATVVCRVLATELGLDPEALAARHDIRCRGGNHARITHAPPVPADTVCLGEHSDFGGVTVLFNQLGGLQVLLPNTKEWKYVKPQPGVACINLGDAFTKFTGGRLVSGVHRVVGPPGEQAKCPRHSVVYFARPNGDARLGDLFVPEEEWGEVPTADEWIARRVKNTMLDGFKGEETYHAGRGTEHRAKADLQTYLAQKTAS